MMSVFTKRSNEMKHLTKNQSLRPGFLFGLLITLLLATSTTLALEVTYIAPEDGPIRCEIWDPVAEEQFSIAPETTMVRILITDGIAQAVLTQTFVNPLTDTTDAKYVFPLPHDASVHGMNYLVDEKLIMAQIREREEAQQIYDSIAESGGNAALLVQEKPNIFQQSMANIPPGDTVKVNIFLSMPLKYVDGTYELAFPTFIGARCCNPGEGSGPVYGTITGADYWNPPANLDGPRVKFAVAIQTGFGIENISSPTHPVSVGDIDHYLPVLQEHNLLEAAADLIMEYTNAVVLDEVSTVPNSDFVLRFDRINKEDTFKSLSYWGLPGADDLYFMYSLYPSESLLSSDTRAPIEWLLLVDISGSQSGWPLTQEKAIATEILTQIQPHDRLGLLSFESHVQYAFADTIVPADPANISNARTFIEGLQPEGGTDLLGAIQEILAIPPQNDMKRVFVFLTDGFITNEDAIFAELQSTEQELQLLTFGAGDNLNRHFLETAAEIGNGFSTEVTSGDDAAVLTNAAMVKVQSPQIKNISVTAGNDQEIDVEAPGSSVLYRGLPYTVYGKMSRGNSVNIPLTISGDKEGEAVTFSDTIRLAGISDLNWSVPKLWAKKRINRLEYQEGTSEDNKDTIISVSLEHQVLSKYTAFIAFENNEPVESDPGQNQNEADGAYSMPPSYNVGYSSSALSYSSGSVYGSTTIDSRLFETTSAPRMQAPKGPVTLNFWNAREITLQAKTPSDVKVSLCDASGREIKMIWSGYVSASLTMPWESAEIAPGSYQIVVESNGTKDSYPLVIQ